MASVIVCVTYNGKYVINKNQINNLSDDNFYNIFVQNNRKRISSINMNGYYQHDNIYKYFKNTIFDFIKKNPSHYVLTDGIKAGDTNYQKFFMVDILNIPDNFTKKYRYVLHLRLEDFVTHNLYIKKERIVELLQKIDIEGDNICIVCKKPTTEFENQYIHQLIQHAKNKNLNVLLEHNDTITDFYIMKEAELLICSKSTLSWCAAFFSDKINKCFIPDYDITPNSTFKRPIENTEMY